MAQQYPQQGNDPQITYTDPMAYALYLRGRGLNPIQIDDLMRQRFGPGETPEERARKQQKQQEQAGWAQTGGLVGGALLAGEAAGGFPTIGGLFGSGATGAGVTGAGVAGAGVAGTAGTTGAVAQPTLLGGAGALETGGASTLGSIGSVALPVAAGAAALSNMWETGMKDIVRGRGNRADWINQAVNVAPVLGLPGTGGLVNLGLRLMGKRSVGAMVTSGKSTPQLLRDDFRGDLRQAGVATQIKGSDHVTLADGSKFNIGLDGKTKYQNVGENIDGKTSRNAWDVDFSNPLAKFATDKIDPMIRNIYGADDPKRKFFPGQYTGILVNAVTSNAKNEQDVLANINAVLGKSKFAQQAGVGVQTPPPPKPGKGEVVRVSPGMYMNDKGHIEPAKTVRQALQVNYGKTGKSK